MSKNYFNEVATKEEFHIVFAISRMIIFEVNYYTLEDNKHPHFTTQANMFNQPKTNWKVGGQAQWKLLKGRAKDFWKKWDAHHLKDLDDDTYFEIRKDLEKLMKAYPYVLKVKEDTEKEVRSIYFWEKKELSMTFPRKR